MKNLKKIIFFLILSFNFSVANAQGSFVKANFSAASVCLNNPTVFNDLSTADNNSIIIFWAWDFGDGSLIDNSQNPQHTFLKDGKYNVKLVVMNDKSQADSATIEITVYPFPIADFDTLSIENGKASFINKSSFGNNFWMFGDDSISMLEHPTHTYAASGNFTVCLSVMNQTGCRDSICKTFMFKLKDDTSLVNANFSAAAVCIGNATVFNNLSEAKNSFVVQQVWDFGDGTKQDTAQNPTHLYMNAGKYFVLLGVMNNKFQQDSITIPVVVNGSPDVSFTANETSGCDTLTTQFTDKSTVKNAKTVLWNWDFGDASAKSNSQHPSHRYQSAGNYTISLKVTSDAGCESSDVKTNFITIHPTPVVDFTSAVTDKTVSFKSSITGDSYSWDFGDGNTATKADTIHTYKDYETYKVCLTVNKSGCQDSVCKMVKIKIGISDGIDENNLDASNITIYPNPSNGKFTIEISDFAIYNLQFTIYNLLGEVIFNQQISKSANQQIDLSAHPKGIYFLQLQTEKGMVYRKLMKE